MVTCKQRADHFTPMMWFDFVRWRFHFIRRLFHYLNYIKYNQIDVIQNCISSETYNWYMYTIWDMVSHIYGFHRCLPKEKWEVKRFLLVLVPIGILWNNLWSVSRYIMGSFSGWWRLGGDDLRYLAAPIWKCRSGSPIHIFHRFVSKLHILHKFDKYCPLGSCLKKMWHTR